MQKKKRAILSLGGEGVSNSQCTIIRKLINPSQFTIRLARVHAQGSNV
jgi:hypothetical protein